jgi:hypothetical protein
LIIELISNIDKYELSKLYLFFFSKINGISSNRENESVNELFTQLQSISKISIELIVVTDSLDPVGGKRKNLSLNNINTNNSKDSESKNQYFCYLIAEHSVMRNLGISKIYINTDPLQSDYYCDNIDSYKTFSEVINSIFSNNRISLIHVENQFDSLELEKKKRIQILKDFKLFNSISFCQSAMFYSHNRNIYLTNCAKNKSIPFSENCCGRCDKFKLYESADLIDDFDFKTIL